MDVLPRADDDRRLAPPRRGGWRRAGMAVLCLLLAAGIVWAIAFWPRHDPAAARAAPPVPVVAATSRRADVPVWLDGLGTVQASASVSIHVMADGPLVEVDFHEGQHVHRGELLARIDPRPYQAALDQATAKKAQDEATLANARLDLARYEKLAKNAYTSAQTADTQRATVAQLEAQLRQDQAQVDTARTNLSYTTITAPIDGRAGFRSVDVGNIVHPTDTTPLTVISQMRPVDVVLTLPQQDLPAISAAMAAGAPEAVAMRDAADGDAADGDATPLDRGTLAVLDNSVDSATGTIRLKATFPNARRALWPGAFVTVRVHVATLRQVVVVPPGAVLRGPAGAYVYVIDDAGIAHRRAVTTGHADLHAIVITAGLDAGQRIAVEGAARLSDGARVSVMPDAAGPDAAGPVPDGAPNGTPDRTPDGARAPG
ncbi:efflux RND transporter periplasmic adaptor subunit [Acidisphaera rubrifaciens]|uniref:Multidrug resistance efflux pump acriflavin resistance protein HlyD/AcrB/AcrD/AcrF n=1 Tax=Acidisphaera rubrifaciens HS-AP3 TaxID=1231350 RepID=A0A0D6P5L6_9PROT|nr:efflux RND transporter periplasmic adaptor subunit [Acidisphaera rubrifaciens]GAN76159.1 multidrug resistance efflux pump acriflavin resistance protein HlyD/AcrB/AcrD/AcrF [Acidisphaera rubrifaciens HS-AP3]